MKATAHDPIESAGPPLDATASLLLAQLSPPPPQMPPRNRTDPPSKKPHKEGAADSPRTGGEKEWTRTLGRQQYDALRRPSPKARPPCVLSFYTTRSGIDMEAHVEVGPSKALVDYILSYLHADENAYRTNGVVSHLYGISAR